MTLSLNLKVIWIVYASQVIQLAPRSVLLLKVPIFDLLPEAPLGIPLLAWAGSAIMLVILVLLFL